MFYVLEVECCLIQGLILLQIVKILLQIVQILLQIVQILLQIVQILGKFEKTMFNMIP